MASTLQTSQTSVEFFVGEDCMINEVTDGSKSLTVGGLTEMMDNNNHASDDTNIRWI